ncbi:MAG TPA: hypothetical protein VK642_12265 [Burkholderiales bacterium]|nr:hypothetical protein [Burkholderiales bacterium]
MKFLRVVRSGRQNDAASCAEFLNYGWGCGKISVANDAKVNFKGDSHGSEEKSKEKSS